VIHLLLEEVDCINETLRCDWRLVTYLHDPALVVLMVQWDLVKEIEFLGDLSYDGLEVVFVGVNINSESLTFWRQSDGECFTLVGSKGLGTVSNVHSSRRCCH
jgi:hypothetical protein